MITVPEAMDSILQTAALLPTERCSLEQATGRVLASDVLSQWNSPPFDKSLMDGFALCFDSEPQTGDRFQITETVTAGEVPTQPLQSGEAVRIMTGAMLPENTTGVAPIEITESATPETVKLLKPIGAEANLMRKATSLAQGDLALSAGIPMGVAQIGLLAEIGVAHVDVAKWPEIGLLSTGDELVEFAETPGPGQIRNSNQIMLASQLQHLGDPQCLGIAADEKSILQQKITQGLTHDMLILTGGVSVGDKDFVPQILEQSGVETIFHGIAFKPGKPLYLGRCAREGKTDCLIFGLPGNPVSSLICCEVFVKTALRKMLGLQPFQPQPMKATLGHEFFVRGNRPTYYPARILNSENGIQVHTVKWHGSADLASTTAANGMILFHEPGKTYEQGEIVDVMAWGEELPLPIH